MKFKKIDNIKAGLIFDGLEDDYYEYDLIIKCKNENIQSSVKPYKFEYINKLLQKISREEYFSLMKSISGSVQSQLIQDMFTGYRNFPLTYHVQEKDNSIKILIIASSGETQPGRYKIYLEGVWEIIEK
ncbi:MAG: hypothetical protein ACOZCO_16660 [Bacteroidota bacterium]